MKRKEKKLRYLKLRYTERKTEKKEKKSEVGIQSQGQFNAITAITIVMIRDRKLIYLKMYLRKCIYFSALNLTYFHKTHN